MSEAVVLRGKISGYRSQRGAANFFFTQADRRALGMAAVGAALIGAAGPAMSTAIAASDMEEEADQVEFMIDGKQVSGWVWRSPFADGDEVEVVSEWDGEHYSAIAINRPLDRMIAMYPHLAKGRWAHVLNALKWWFWGMSIFTVAFTLLVWVVWAADGSSMFSEKVIWGYSIALLSLYALMLLPAIHMTLKYMRFVRAAEKVFKVLGWKNVGFIDLNKSSKARRQGDEAPEYGTYYFRY